MSDSTQAGAVSTEMAFAHNSEIQALANSNRPAFLWSAEGRTLLWVNGAALTFTDASEQAELLLHDFGASLAAQIEMLLRLLPQGATRLERFKLTLPSRTVSLIARVKAIPLETGSSGLLTVGLESVMADAAEGMEQKIKKKEEEPAAHQPLTIQPVTLPTSANTGTRKKQKKTKSVQAKSEKKKTKKKASRQDPSQQLEPHERESLRLIAEVLSGRRTPESIIDEQPGSTGGTSVPNEELQRTMQAIKDLQQENAALRNELNEARVLTAELQTILDTATDGILILDEHGGILNTNRPTEALFGQDHDALAGQNLLDLLAPESREAARSYLHEFSESGVARLMNDGCEILVLERNGGVIPLFMTLGSLGGQIPGYKFCAVLRDITQWKKAEKDLISAKRKAEDASGQKSDFLAKISHEIRTPLNAIIGFSEIMAEERFGPIRNERYKSYLGDIHMSGGHILSLINDLLDLSKIESGKLELNFSSVDLNDLVAQTTAMMQAQANRKGIIMRSSLQAIPAIVADPRSLRQIMLNLLANAVRFTRAGGQIIVSTGIDNDSNITLRVRDTGIGMSEEELTVALEPFRQVSNNSGKEGLGTGLGLPITKALAEANHARFQIVSAPDAGTSVSVIFPQMRALDD